MENEIFFNENEIELIGKATSGNRFPFPVVTVGGSYIYFNQQAAEMIPERIRWAVTPEYVIILAANKGDKDAFKARTQCSGIGKQAAFPAILKRDKKLQPGNYRLYKCNGGCAFKRYEPMEG